MMLLSMKTSPCLTEIGALHAESHWSVFFVFFVFFQILLSFVIFSFHFYFSIIYYLFYAYIMYISPYTYMYFLHNNLRKLHAKWTSKKTK